MGTLAAHRLEMMMRMWIQDRRHAWARIPMIPCMALPFMVALCLIQGVSGETLRLSHVRQKEAPDVERYELKHEGGAEVMFVEKKAIITGADVESVMRNPSDPDSLDFTLSKAGEGKLSEATKDVHGIERIAIIIDGELISAPVVQSSLGKSFQVSGLKEQADDLDFFCWKIQGKDADEIAQLLKNR